MNIIKPTANQISLTTANTIYNSRIVYLAATTAATITVANTSANLSSFTIPANTYLFVDKNPTDTLTANLAVFATPASYRG